MNTGMLYRALLPASMFLKHSLQVLQVGLYQPSGAIAAAHLIGSCAFSADDPHFYSFSVSSQILLGENHELHFLGFFLGGAGFFFLFV